MKAIYRKHVLSFKNPSGTSRGILKTKETWYIIITSGNKQGIGECGILRTLSIDDRVDYEDKLKWACENIHLGAGKLWSMLIEFPSIQFGIEMAFISLESDSPFILFPSDFTKGIAPIAINGLIWMGEKEFMRSQIIEKINQGFNCIKLKIGALDFDTELDLLSFIRTKFSDKLIELRVDANGAFDFLEVKDKMQKLSVYNLHSIEQPIKKGQYDLMKKICEDSPFPIALDEELIGVFDVVDKINLLKIIKPQYIILKPSLIGGFRGTKEWINIANSLGIGWWITSALESNIGLNAIAQFTFTLQNNMPQGLGTGDLYTNNIKSPLIIKKGKLVYNKGQCWETEFIN